LETYKKLYVSSKRLSCKGITGFIVVSTCRGFSLTWIDEIFHPLTAVRTFCALISLSSNDKIHDVIHGNFYKIVAMGISHFESIYF